MNFHDWATGDCRPRLAAPDTTAARALWRITYAKVSVPPRPQRAWTVPSNRGVPWFPDGWTSPTKVGRSADLRSLAVARCKWRYQRFPKLSLIRRVRAAGTNRDRLCVHQPTSTREAMSRIPVKLHLVFVTVHQDPDVVVALEDGENLIEVLVENVYNVRIRTPHEDMAPDKSFPPPI